MLRIGVSRNGCAAATRAVDRRSARQALLMSPSQSYLTVLHRKNHAPRCPAAAAAVAAEAADHHQRLRTQPMGCLGCRAMLRGWPRVGAVDHV